MYSLKDDLLLEKKKSLRTKILKKRKALLPPQILKLSSIIERKLFSYQFFLKAKSVLFYFQHKNEVHTETMIRKSIEMGKTVSLPVTLWDKKDLYLTQIKNIDEEIDTSRHGIPEPHHSFYRPVKLQNIDMIITPGVGFDIQGNRLGYGWGFYDRLLQKKPKITKTVGLAYDFQLLERLPNETHDIPVDFLISEKQEIDCQRKAQSKEDTKRRISSYDI